MYDLGFVPKDPAVAARAWQVASAPGGTAPGEALKTFVTHAEPDGRGIVSIEIANACKSENLRRTAIGCLADLGAATELQGLSRLLVEPPAVSWAVHIALIDAFRRLTLGVPQLGDLPSVDNLHLLLSIAALRSTKRDGVSSGGAE